MAKRRGNGEGQIMRYGRKWRVIVRVGKLPNGNPRRKTRVASSYAQALSYCDELRREAASGWHADSSQLTVAEFLELWLEDVVRLHQADNTYLQYRHMVRKHIVPYIGNVQIRKLAPINVQSWVADLARSGAGASTRKQAFACLSAAMTNAVALRLLPFHPCAGLKRPKAPRGEIWPFSHDEVARLFKETEDDRLHELIVTGFLTGMRIGEILGLQWKCIDDDSIRIDWQVLESGKLVLPKGGRRRRIDMPDKVGAALAERRAQSLREGNAASPFVFCSTTGTAIRRSNFYQQFWIPLLVDAEVPHRGFHHVRHTYATEQLRAGVDPQEVAAVLGHSMKVLLETYSHVVSRDRRRAADVADQMYE